MSAALTYLALPEWDHTRKNEMWKSMSPEERIEVKQRQGLADGSLVIRKDGTVACAMCGGNCGQCAMTDTLGNIGFSFETIVRNVVGGEPRPWWRFWR